MSNTKFWVRLTILSVVFVNNFSFAQQTEGIKLEEIVVTARKISENLQEVPISVSVLTGDSMQDLGVNSLAEISKLVPGLLFDSELGRGSNRPVIRGQANILGDSGVSYFIDGVYVNGSIDDYDLNLVERVEIIKGPQSALYGRNTYSGAIALTTKSPGDEFQGNLKVEGAEDGQKEVALAFSGPLSDTVGAGLSVRYYEMDGYMKNAFDGDDIGEQESMAVSGILEFRPNDDFVARLRGYYSERDDGQPAIVTTALEENNCYPDTGSATYGGAGRYLCGEVSARSINTDWKIQAPDQVDTDDSLQLSLRMDYRVNENMNFVSITGYNEKESEVIMDGDYMPTSFHAANFTPTGFPYAGFEDGPPWKYGYAPSMVDFTFANATDREDFSQEFRLELSQDSMTSVIGAYYFQQDSSNWDIRTISDEQQALGTANFMAEYFRMQGVCASNFFCESMVPFGGPTITVPRDVNNLEIENIALFGMVSAEVNEKLSVSAEIRWQEERIKQNTKIQNLGGEATYPDGAKKTFDAFLPRVSLSYQINDDHMIYGLIAKGTKPGGFNGTVAIEAGVPTYDEEDVRTIEIGSKNSLRDGSVTLNGALFFSEIEGYQLTQNVQSGSNTTSAIDNVGDVDIFGFEFEMLAQVTENLRVMFNWAWTDTEFTKGSDQNQGVLEDVLDSGAADCSTGDQFPDVDGCTSLYGNIKGKQVPRTAEHQMFADFEYRDAISNGWEWYAGANFVYESSKYAQVHNLAETGDTSLVNARLGFEKDNFSVQIWGKNLTGEDTAPSVLRYASPLAYTRNFAISPRRDTYFGVTANYSF